MCIYTSFTGRGFSSPPRWIAFLNCEVGKYLLSEICQVFGMMYVSGVAQVIKRLNMAIGDGKKLSAPFYFPANFR